MIDLFIRNSLTSALDLTESIHSPAYEIAIETLVPVASAYFALSVADPESVESAVIDFERRLSDAAICWDNYAINSLERPGEMQVHASVPVLIESGKVWAAHAKRMLGLDEALPKWSVLEKSIVYAVK